MNKPDRWMKFLQILRWVGLAQGAAFAIVALGCAISTVIFIGRSTVTTGVVVELEHHQDDEGSDTFSPIFSFAAKDGTKHTAHSNSSSNPPGFEVGQQVTVRYVAADPSDAKIATFWQTWAFAAGFAIASFVMWLFGLFFMWRVAKRKARKPQLQQIRSLNHL